DATLKRLNLTFYDSNGKFIGMAAVAQELHDKLGPLPDDLRQTAEEALFGARRMGVATVVVREGAAGWQTYRDALNDIGIAQRIASERLDTLQGSLKKLGSSLSSALAQGGE